MIYDKKWISPTIIVPLILIPMINDSIKQSCSRFCVIVSFITISSYLILHLSEQSEERETLTIFGFPIHNIMEKKFVEEIT